MPGAELKEVMCDGQKIVQGEGHKHLENEFEAKAGSR